MLANSYVTIILYITQCTCSITYGNAYETTTLLTEFTLYHYWYLYNFSFLVHIIISQKISHFPSRFTKAIH